MTLEEVQKIARNKGLPGQAGKVRLIETHISWVLMGDPHVYKIKKPLKFSFLDFSSLEKRKHYCGLEVELNRRLAPGMYLGVLPVTRESGLLRIGGESGEVVDYAVWMRRMDEGRQMDLLVEGGEVSQAEMRKLAEVLADFHLRARKVGESETWKELYEEFEDLSGIRSILGSALGKPAVVLVDEVLQWTRPFLSGVRMRIEERKTRGFIVEGHGDLHCRNIFLMDPPVIFDCIEFNEALRTLDMLNEAAFLCMDLERFGREDLAGAFMEHYNALTGVLEKAVDRQLFVYYKMYRANVRLKVHCIHLREGSGSPRERQEEREVIGQYFRLLETYYRQLSGYGG